MYCISGFREQEKGKKISAFIIPLNRRFVLKNSYNKSKCCIIIFALIVMLPSNINTYDKPEFKVCETKSCLQSAVSLVNCMNESVDPCEDFYEFACGMFETNYPSYETDSNNWFRIMSFKVKYLVKKYLTQNDEKYEPEAVHKSRMYYKACLNANIDDNGDKFMSDVLIKMGLPTNYFIDSSPLEIEKTIAKINVYFETGLFIGIGIDNDPRNSTSHLLLVIGHDTKSENFKYRNNVKTKVVTIEDEYTINSKEMIDKWSNHSYFKQLYTDNSMKQKLHDFEMKYNKILQDASDYKNDTFEIFTLRQLQNLTDSTANIKFNWALYLKELFRYINPIIYEQLASENSDDYEILISNSNYLYDLLILLSETSTKTIKMSILKGVLAIWKNSIPSSTHLNSDDCYYLTTKSFGLVTGYSMVNTLDNTSKTELTEMADNIKWALRKMVNEVTWMDEETKIAMLRKITNTRTLLGFPDNYTDILNNSFQDLSLTENHWENIKSIAEYNAKINSKYLIDGRSYEESVWSLIIGEVNALALPWRNEFYMPVAVLQPPFYHNGIQALNYGTTGSTIGHELSHNYDTIGRMYNEWNEMVQWWTDKSYNEYTKRAECLVEHYNNVTFVSHNKTFNIDGLRTLNENIADIVGLKEAYYAYQRYVDIHGQEPRLPGLEQYSQEQLIFLGYANHYCNYDKNDIQPTNVNDVHSPFVVRVREVLSLLPEFAKAWSCPLGSPMNPNKTRCQLW